MNIAELRKYEYWVGQPAGKIALAAKNLGGWKSVFPNSLPRWASKVRNYFNLLPTTLKRVPDKQSKALLNHVQTFKFLYECHRAQTANKTFRNYKQNPDGSYDKAPFEVAAGCPATPDYDVQHTGIKDAIAMESALSGQVYLDEHNAVWYQMAAGSTIYHWGRDPIHHWMLAWAANPVEAIWTDKVRGQNDTPVFKLISPDGTGGSREIILLNDGVSAYTSGGGRNEVATVNEGRVNIRNLVVTDAAYQGSYNYSETAQVGLAAHTKRDIEPHVGGRRFYVNPKDMFVPLDQRKLPPNDLDGKPLATQV